MEIENDLGLAACKDMKRRDQDEEGLRKLIHGRHKRENRQNTCIMQFSRKNSSKKVNVLRKKPRSQDQIEKVNIFEIPVQSKERYH